MTRERSFWFGKTFDAGSRAKTGPAEGVEDDSLSAGRVAASREQRVGGASPNDPRVFPLTRSRITPPPSREQEIRQEAFEEAVLIARLYEERGANASAVRIALEARARTPLEETPPQSGRATGVSSSGAEPTLSPSAPLPLTYELWLSAITHAYDEILRALGTPEPRSLKAAVPKLKRVK